MLREREMSVFENVLTSVVALERSLEKMQAAGKIEKSVEDALETIVTLVAKREQFWFQGKPSPRTFATYHAWRNLRLIFSKMRTRFANAQLVHDNPLVVDQARETIPRILSALASLIAMERDPSAVETSEVLKRIRELRSSARQVDMIQTSEEELREIDPRKLESTFDELLNRMATLGAA
jgi:hypothetical protein